MSEDGFVSAYQELVKVECHRLNSDPGLDSCLSLDDVRKACERFGVDYSVFVDRGLLVDLGGGRFRTVHGDLIYRVVNTRAFPSSAYRVCDYCIEVRDEGFIPDFNDYGLSPRVLSEMSGLSEKDVAPLFYAFTEFMGIKGVSFYQYEAVKSICCEDFRVYGVVAPTAAGKTLVFVLSILFSLVSGFGGRGVRAVVLYPRRALSRNQLQRFIDLLYYVNECYCGVLGRYLCIGADYGDVDRRAEVGKPYLGLKCPDRRCRGSLLTFAKGSRTVVRCKNCGKVYEWIFADKETIWRERPDIYVSNIWTLYRRILDTPTLNLFSGLKYLVLDEAHVYVYYLGGHVYYVLRVLTELLLKRAGTKIIVSSATIPRPREFLRELLGVDDKWIKVLDYRDISEKYYEGKRRPCKLTILVFLLPNPNYSVETITEDAILMAGLWCWRHGYIGIAFTDSVAEVNTLYDYIISTILGSRRGREVLDHIVSWNIDVSDDYSWRSLVPPKYLSDVSSWLTSEYRGSIGMHYGLLDRDERAKIEEAFMRGDLRMLIATSTLELGVDISDAAIIIQHKLPRDPESLIQRVGRAGRSKKCMYISLGFIVLQQSPIASLYLYNKDLREKLLSLEEHPGLKISKNSLHLKLQHGISAMLAQRARQGLTNYINITLSRINYKNALKKVIIPLRNSLVRYPQSFTLLNKLFGHTESKVLSRIEKFLNEINNLIEISNVSYEKLNKYITYIEKIKEELVKCSKLLKRTKCVYIKTPLIENFENNLGINIVDIVRRACGNNFPGGLRRTARACGEVIKNIIDSYSFIYSISGKVINFSEKFIFNIKRVFFDVKKADLLENVELFENYYEYFTNIMEELQSKDISFNVIGNLKLRLKKKLDELGCDNLSKDLIIRRIILAYTDNEALKNITKYYAELYFNLMNLIQYLCIVSESLYSFSLLLREENIKAKSIIEDYLRKRRYKAFNRLIEEKFISGEKITLLDALEFASRVLGNFFFSQLLEEPSHKLVVRRES